MEFFKQKRLVQPVKMLNFILIVTCIVGFVYQDYLILDKYMLRNTVLNIEVKRYEPSNNQPLPAITVCIPLLSITNLSGFKKLNLQFYQDYMKLFNESSNKRTDKYVKEHLLINTTF